MAPLTPQRVADAHRVQAHRGPDGHGDWAARCGDFQVGLAHQRLAILDLSDAGLQPMHGADGAVVAFNGEIYNYVELREELRRAGESFRTGTDTEVLVASIRRWGVDEALRRFNGMWAFAWLDPTGRRLVLSRDRCGEKPLYIRRDGHGVMFASEIKTILALSGGRHRVNPRTAAAYLNQAVLEGTDETFFEGIEKVPAGTAMTIDLVDGLPGRTSRYWSAPEECGPRRPAGEYLEELHAILSDSVRIRLRSDVPVGVLLSGGLDSSAIAALATRLRGSDARATMLSAVSDDPRYDESRFVDIVAAHLSVPVTKVNLSLAPERAFDALGPLTRFNDQPLLSFSAVAHHELMRAAREHGVTVILSGQGGDELFCGYRKYLGFAVQAALRGGSVLSALGLVAGFAANRTVLTQFDVSDAARYLPRWLRPPAVSIAGAAIRDVPPVALGLAPGASVNARQALDVARTSVPSLVHYEDRMSMAMGREIRLPFLDPRLIDAAIRLPVDAKLHRGWTKYALRQAMAAELPPAIVWRKDKQGFSLPQAEWLRGPLASRVRAVLEDPSAYVYRAGLVDRERMGAVLRGFLADARGGGAFRSVFAPLAMEFWMREFGDAITWS